MFLYVSFLKIADLTLSLWIGAGKWSQEPIAQALVVPSLILTMSLLVAVAVPVEGAIARGCDCPRSCYGDAMPLTLRHAGGKAALVRIPHSGHAVISAFGSPGDPRVLGCPGCGVES